MNVLLVTSDTARTDVGQWQGVLEENGHEVTLLDDASASASSADGQDLFMAVACTWTDRAALGALFRGWLDAGTPGIVGMYDSGLAANTGGQDCIAAQMGLVTAVQTASSTGNVSWTNAGTSPISAVAGGGLHNWWNQTSGSPPAATVDAAASHAGLTLGSEESSGRVVHFSVAAGDLDVNSAAMTSPCVVLWLRNTGGTGAQPSAYSARAALEASIAWLMDLWSGQQAGNNAMSWTAASAVNGMSAVTMEFWVQRGDLSAGGTLPQNVHATLHGSEGWEAGVDDSGFPFTNAQNSNEGVVKVTATTAITDSLWHHVAFVIEPGAGTKIYLDGALVGSGAAPSAIDDGDSFFIRNKGGWRGFAELRVWGAARSQAEIQARMNSRLAGTEADLVGYWPMDEGMGSTAADGIPGGTNDLTESHNGGVAPARWGAGPRELLPDPSDLWAAVILSFFDASDTLLETWTVKRQGDTYARVSGNHEIPASTAYIVPESWRLGAINGSACVKELQINGGLIACAFSEPESAPALGGTFISDITADTCAGGGGLDVEVSWAVGSQYTSPDYRIFVRLVEVTEGGFELTTGTPLQAFATETDPQAGVHTFNFAGLGSDAGDAATHFLKAYVMIQQFTTISRPLRGDATGWVTQTTLETPVASGTWGTCP